MQSIHAKDLATANEIAPDSTVGMNSLLSYLYFVPKDHISNDLLLSIRKELTLTPPATKYRGDQTPPSYTAYGECDTHIGVPIFYGLKRWGLARDNRQLEGDRVVVNFCGTLRTENNIQQNAVAAVLRELRGPTPGGTLVVPCGMGKTFMGVYIFAKLGYKCIWLTDDTDLMRQTAEEFARWCPGLRIGYIREDVFDIVDKDFVIATLQTLYSRKYSPCEFFSFGLMVVDEAHIVGARTYLSVVLQLPIKRRLALTATPERGDRLERIIYWSMGAIVYRCERPYQPSRAVQISYGDSDQSVPRYRNGNAKDAVIIDRLCEDPARNAFITEVIRMLVNQGRKTVVFCCRASHARTLRTLCEENVTTDCSTWIGADLKSTPVADRERAKEARVIFATRHKAGKGWNVPDIDTVFIALPDVKNPLQMMGRAERQYPDKKSPLFVEVYDPFHFFTSISWAHNRYLKAKHYNIQRISHTEAPTNLWLLE